MALLEVDDLTPFATIDDVEAEAMVADAIALATLAAPCLGGVDLTVLQVAQAKAVLRSAVIRWHESGSGLTSQTAVGPFQQTVTPLARKSLFWPSEIDALRNICKSATSGGAFSVDTAATAMRFHSVLCGFGGEFCTCGTDSMARFPAPTEQVIRHRGGSRDENGQLIAAEDEPLLAIAVAPRGGSEVVERARDSEIIACTVYFPLGTDVVNSDEMTVRGERFHVVVNDWHLSGFGGLEVLCTRGQG